MPLPKGPHIKEGIAKLRTDEPTLSPSQIAKRLGISHGTVTYHLANLEGRPVSPSKQNKTNRTNMPMHKLTDADVRTVKNLTVRGISGREIHRQTGLSTYNVWKALDQINRHKAHKAIVPAKTHGYRSKDKTLAMRKKIYDLKQTGLTHEAIGKMLHLPKGTVSSAYYAFMKQNSNGTSKGAILIRHEHQSTNASSTNGTAEEGPTKAELIGFAWAHIERAATDISERIAVPRDFLRRRLSKLLSFEALR